MPGHEIRSTFSTAAIAKSDTEQRAKIFASLADPTRLGIVELLSVQGEMSSSEIANQAEISLALLCHHSKILSESGLVHTRKDGQTRYYRLNQDLLAVCFESLVAPK
ncbi:MAG: helix-turn-helix transcriptional regulator [Oscillatoriophycideae cyanobacterium NC_groundwater_1537_Pr4_S-0.65um_50_18]|jgi:DNA-binding transcriptional ArsR family regulator|nr:helix-turn-helix transcriptional regulator [Oscillatoriophycideae cyanobacterium NC_groundwater_1537_Pr4_S-0.65um_50_18]